MKDRIRYKGFIGSVHYASEDRVFYGFSTTYKHYHLTEENDTSFWDYQ